MSDTNSDTNINNIDTIHMTVLHDTGFLSRYWSRKPVISEDVAAFLDHATDPIAQIQKKQLKIEIASNEIDRDEKELYTRAIHNYYRNQLTALERERKRNLFSSMGLLAIGTVILCLMVIFEGNLHSAVVSEIVDIAGWVFIWEAVDQLWFERHKLNNDYNKRKALAGAAVVYTPLSDKDRKICQEEAEH